MLQRAGVDSLISECVSSGVPELVRMNRETNLCHVPRPGKHLPDRRRQCCRRVQALIILVPNAVSVAVALMDAAPAEAAQGETTL